MRLRRALWDSLLRLLLCLSVLSERRHVLLREDVLRLVEAKRAAEGRAVLSTLRPGICLVLERDCCFKIFNSWLASALPAAQGPVFLYSGEGQTVRIGGAYAFPGIPYFILSPYIDADWRYSCHYYDYHLGQYMERGLADIYRAILDRIDGAGCSRFDLDEVHYSRTRLRGLELCRFSVEELGEVCFTRYSRDPPMMRRVGEIADGLVGMPKAMLTKMAWSTRAVALLMAMLVGQGVLRARVDLAEYPDIVPLLFPFRFLDTESAGWAPVNMVSVGLDLRGVARSGLVHLFDMQAVGRLCAEGGVYIVSRRF